MKKLLFLAAMALPSLLFSQAPLKTKFESTYVEASRSMVNLKVMVTVADQDGSYETIMNENGKNWEGSTIHLINYMDKQGFEFVCFVPIPAGVPMLERILFRRKD